MATEDRRNDGPAFPIARYEFAQQSWASGETTALAPTLKINGTIKAIEVVVSNATNGITVTVALSTSDSAAAYSKASIAENASTWLDAVSHKGTPDADFNPIPINDTVTATITPSGDPGTSGVTVDVKLWVE